MKFQSDALNNAISISPDWVLRRKDYYEKLARATSEVMERLDLSRRDVPDWLADRIFGYEGRILSPDGSDFPVTDTLIDDAFNNDGSFRWVSDFVCQAGTPPKQKPQRRVLPRLRLIELALRIEKSCSQD